MICKKIRFVSLGLEVHNYCSPTVTLATEIFISDQSINLIWLNIRNNLISSHSLSVRRHESIDDGPDVLQVGVFNLEEMDGQTRHVLGQRWEQSRGDRARDSHIWWGRNWSDLFWITVINSSHAFRLHNNKMTDVVGVIPFVICISSNSY